MKRHLREFDRDLCEALETRWLGVQYIIRAGTKRRGGNRLIIFNPRHPMESCRTKIIRTKSIIGAIKKAVREAFGQRGLDYFMEHKKKGVTGMAGRKLKKVAKKKKGATGVRRKLVSSDGTEPICAYGGERILCKQVLNSKRELQAGLCEAHILIEAEEKKEAAKINRQKAKNERENNMAKKLAKKAGAKKVNKKETKKGAAKKTAAKKSAKKVTKKSGSAAGGSSRGGGARILIMDKYPATTFIRTLAKGGLSFDQINAAIKSVHKGKGKDMPKEGTIRIQSSKGKRGDGEIITGDGAVTKLIKEFKNK